MGNFWNYLMGFGIVILCQACYSPQQGALSPEVRTELDRVAFGGASTPTRYYRLTDKLAELLEEVNAIDGDENAMTRIQKFASDNDVALERLSRQIDHWLKALDPYSRNEFIILSQARPATTKLRTLVPRFRNRIDYRKEWLQAFDALMKSVWYYH